MSAAATPTVTKLRRPRPYLADPPLAWDTGFSFIVKSGPTGDRTPLTVEARAIRRAKLPGEGMKVARQTFALRASDQVEGGGSRPRWRALRRSQEIVELSREEEGLVEEGELRAAALLKAQFWTAPDSSLEVRERIVAMQERAFEPQVESEAEESEAEAIDLGAVRARTLVVVGEHDKADFHPIAERLAREIPDAQRAVIAGACHLPALERPAETARPVRDFLGI